MAVVVVVVVVLVVVAPPTMYARAIPSPEARAVEFRIGPLAKKINFSYVFN